MGKPSAHVKKLAGCLGGFAVGAAVYLLCGGEGLSPQGLACLAGLAVSVPYWQLLGLFS